MQAHHYTKAISEGCGALHSLQLVAPFLTIVGMKSIPPCFVLRTFSCTTVLLAGITACSLEAQTITREDAAFLDDLQRRTFGYFWETTNAENGLTPDRAPRKSFASIAAIGFALTSYPIAVEHGWISREEAAGRTLTTLTFFNDAPQGKAADGMSGYKGFFYHFLDRDTGERFRTNELSTIDTALLMAGVLFASEYFDADNATEAKIRNLADSLYRNVQWDWMQQKNGRIGHGWKPEQGALKYSYEGYNEAMLLYVLALGSPTHPVEQRAWKSYTSTYVWDSFHGFEMVNFSPLFGHQYSHVWIDFRGIEDAYMGAKGIDYFENSTRMTKAQRAYAIANPMKWQDYGANIWGLTACDGPARTTRVVGGEERQFFTYTARGVSSTHIRDDGTIAPTAVGGSIAFAPEICVPALRAIHARYGESVYGKFGFIDCFNPTFTFDEIRLRHGKIVPGKGWFDTDYLGIDQGPIITMIENFRTGLVWKLMRNNRYIQHGLREAGFSGGWLDLSKGAGDE